MFTLSTPYSGSMARENAIGPDLVYVGSLRDRFQDPEH
jgi:hypothetical protein